MSADHNRQAVRVPPAPEPPKHPVTDTLHGREITDPYRQLEDSSSAETREWTAAHNRRTEAVLDQLPATAICRERLSELLSSEVVDTPRARGNILFYTHRRRNEDQPRLCAADEKGETVLLNPNREDETGLTSLDWWYPSPDGSRLAYGYSHRGDEWSTLRILDVRTGDVLPETIDRTRGASVAWKPDGRGFYYTRYPAPGEVAEGEQYYHRRVFYHRVGADPAEDPMVFGEGRPKEEMYQVRMSPNGRYLLVTAHCGWRRNDVYVRDEMKEKTDFTPVITGEDALFTGEISGNTLYLLTNLDAPRYRIVAADLDSPGPDSWVDIVPEQPDLTIRQMKVLEDQLVVSCLRDATSHLFVCDADGSGWTEVELPFAGTAAGLTGGAADEAHFTFQSFVRSPAIYRLNARERTVKVVRSSEQPVDPDDFEVRQVFYSSRDGTRVPMFILHHRDAELDRARPTVLTGYGGFNISRAPTYSPAQIPWLQSGGIYALANLRGGSEYGEDWHRAGMLANKQNVFDDFIAAAEFLIEQNWTNPDHLGIHGASNGGLLVGAALTQRPALFGAVACGVPLLDMLRYHRFLIAGIWAAEYGSADDPEQFEWLAAYSPYHHVSCGTEYPAVYLYTAASDSRVHPLHARKMAARLQETSASGAPILLHVEEDAGHGAGKPVSKLAEAQARMWAFFSWQLDLAMSPAAPGRRAGTE
ncbi:MAG: prolyl oligopeptidase family serine peptidase [Bacillota bacterium]